MNSVWRTDGLMFSRSSTDILKGFKKWLGYYKLYHYRIPLEIDGRYKTRKSGGQAVLIDPVPPSNSRDSHRPVIHAKNWPLLSE